MIERKTRWPGFEWKMGPNPTMGKERANKWKRPEMEGKWPKNGKKKLNFGSFCYFFVTSSTVHRSAIFSLFWLLAHSILYQATQDDTTDAVILMGGGGGFLGILSVVQSAPKERRRRRAEKRSSKRVFLESPFLLCPLRVSS